MSSDKTWAPVALFVYDRLDNIRRTIIALQKNVYADKTVVYVFSDGGKDDKSWTKVNEVRKYLKTVTGFKQVIIVEREVNYYIERNIMEGITEVIKHHGEVIMLEDDIVTSPYFLEFMNDALCAYRNDGRVMHVAGLTYLDVPEKGDIYFTPLMLGSGAWATWADRWDKFSYYADQEKALEGLSGEDINKIEYQGAFRCLKSLAMNPIPWDVCWYLSVYRNHGLCLSPAFPLVRNNGMRQGTHFNFRFLWLFGRYCFDRPLRIKKMTVDPNKRVELDPEIEAMNLVAYKNFGLRFNWFGKIVRYFYLRIKKANSK